MNLFKNSIPCIALLAAVCCVGTVPISAAVCADMIAGIVILPNATTRVASLYIKNE